MLSNQQIESFIYDFRTQLQKLNTQGTKQDQIIEALQQTLNALPDQVNMAVSSNNSVNTDTYLVGGQILHKLKTLFQAAVTFASTILVQGIATFSAAPVLSSLTASRPLKLDGTKAVISAKIDLAAPTTDIQNTLGIANGGTGGVTAAAARASLGAAAIPQTVQGSNFTTPNVSTVAGGSQSVTVTGSSFTAPAGGGACTGTFTFTINGSNFTIIFAGAPNTGSQALV